MLAGWLVALAAFVVAEGWVAVLLSGSPRHARSAPTGTAAVTDRYPRPYSDVARRRRSRSGARGSAAGRTAAVPLRCRDHPGVIAAGPVILLESSSRAPASSTEGQTRSPPLPASGSARPWPCSASAFRSGQSTGC
jgi:hypothetical protein